MDYTFSTGGHPKMDFAILDDKNNIKYFIEYQGEQHYEPRGNIFTPEKVAQIQQRDKEKLQYCQNINIPIKYIKYTEYENLKLENLLLESKI